MIVRNLCSAFVLGGFLAACSGTSGNAVAPFLAGSATPVPTASPSPSPTASITAGSVAVSPNAISFLGTGSAFATTVSVTQTGADSGFQFTTPAASATNSCTAVASEAAGANGGSFTITPLGVGHCVFTVSGANGQSAPLTIDVTVSNVGGQ